jgi:NADH:ubiquinone oxidoreductase subunit E
MKVCTGKSCTERFSKYIAARVVADKAKFDKNDKIAIEECLCRGKCQEGPNFLYEKELFTRGNPVKASEVFLRKLAELEGKPEKSKKEPE